jgi:hypothetical protein
VRRGSLALAALEAEPAWAAERPAGAVHRNSGRASQRAVTRLVGHEVRTPATVPSSPCQGPRLGVRRLVSGASVHACLSTRPASGVRCGRLRVQVSSVRRRCPVGVRCPCVSASMVSDRIGVVERGAGQAAVWLGWPGSAWEPVVYTTGSLSAQVRAWRSELAQAVLASGGVGLALAVVVGGGWPWRRRPRGRPGEAECARGSPVGREPGAQRGSSSCGRVRGMSPSTIAAQSPPRAVSLPETSSLASGPATRCKGVKRRVAQIGGGDYAPWSPCEA